ncbi:thioredoxin family protein [Nocardiopsis protaetiae]|uniref:thioredoxin family protein n=1 Tax=Nocardiopsis protaetiae TaxID=3382270 RepID=UPI00387AD1A3
MTTVELTDENSDSTIGENDIVLVDFRAARCGPCLRFAPVFERSSDDDPDIVHGKPDTEFAQRVTTAAGIRAIPTLMAFREGVIVFEQAGALPDPALAQVIEDVRNLDMREVRAGLAALGETGRPTTGCTMPVDRSGAWVARSGRRSRAGRLREDSHASGSRM